MGATITTSVRLGFVCLDSDIHANCSDNRLQTPSLEECGKFHCSPLIPSLTMHPSIGRSVTQISVSFQQVGFPDLHSHTGVVTYLHDRPTG